MKLTKKWVAERLPKRPNNANKGIFGKALVVAGSGNFPGAAYLSCTAIYRVGAGLVALATKPEVKIIVSRKLPEVTFLPLNNILKSVSNYDVLLVGPGLGQSGQTVRLIKQLLTANLPPTIIDADGLNVLSKMGQWRERLDGRAILTPHPGEMARLTSLSIEEIQKNRVSIARSYAQKWRQVIVLKGANTIIASPVGKIMVSPFANPALATAGTGDVLSGIITGMVAQGLAAFDAACVGVYLQGLAGVMLQDRLGNAGAMASDLLPLLPKVIKDLK